jgi:hypothetical protein
VKAAHILKIERRLHVAVEKILPEIASLGEAPDPGLRSAVRDIAELLETDVPDLIDAVRQAQGAQRKYCRYCGERRLGLIVASHDEKNTWECRDEDGCDYRKNLRDPRTIQERDS